MDNNRFGMNVNFRSNWLQAIELCSQLRLKWLRITIYWDQVQQTQHGPLEWRSFDAQIETLRKAGFSLYATVYRTPAWAAKSACLNAPPSDGALFAQFLTQAVNRYRHCIQHWGIWNEPNHPSFLRGSLSDYISLILRPGLAALRSIAPDIRVVGPDLAGNRSGWTQWMTTILATTRNTAGFDIISHHNYETSLDKFWTTIDGKPSIWDMLLRREPSLVTLLDRNGLDSIPIWLTEFGWHTDDVSTGRQADLFGQFAEQLEPRKRIDRVFAYELMDDPGHPEKWGIAESTGKPKPAMNIVRQLLA